MNVRLWLGVSALSLVAAVSAEAGIIKGVMSVTGAEMDWWGGLVRDTIARQLDVDRASMKYEIEPGKKRYANGTITFAAKKGKTLDLKKLHESLAVTRLGKRTSSGVNHFDITAEGEVVVVAKLPVLKVRGTGQEFSLKEDPAAKPKEGVKTPYQRLEEALAKGDKVVSVTGRVQGWNGKWPGVLKDLAAAEKDKEKRTALAVRDFRIAAKE